MACASSRYGLPHLLRGFLLAVAALGSAMAAETTEEAGVLPLFKQEHIDSVKIAQALLWHGLHPVCADFESLELMRRLVLEGTNTTVILNISGSDITVRDLAMAALLASTDHYALEAGHTYPTKVILSCKDTDGTVVRFTISTLSDPEFEDFRKKYQAWLDGYEMGARRLSGARAGHLQSFRLEAIPPVMPTHE